MSKLKSFSAVALAFTSHITFKIIYTHACMHVRMHTHTERGKGGRQTDRTDKQEKDKQTEDRQKDRHTGRETENINQ